MRLFGPKKTEAVDMSRDGCYSLNSHLFSSKACIVGATAGTDNTFIDVTKQMVGYYEVMIRKDCKHYLVELGIRIEDHTPTSKQFVGFTKTFAFICEQCGIRGRFGELALHSAVQHPSLYLRMDYIKIGEDLRPLPMNVYAALGTPGCC